MTDAVEIVLTGPAGFIQAHCRHLVENRLVACAQIVLVESTYRWQGEVEKDSEARAALHTLRSNVTVVSRHTRETHPYDTPCIIVLPILDADRDYLEWITESVIADERTP